MMNKIYLKIRRRDRPEADSYWEDFQVVAEPGMNVIAGLMEIQKNPVNARGEGTTPVVWEEGCLEEGCGSCTMIINGEVRPACSALLGALSQPVRIEPLSKFPVVRDLVVDRSKMFEALKKVKGWIPIDGTHSMGAAPAVRFSGADRLKLFELAQCTSCGACLEVCPQYHEKSPFIGAAAISQVRRFDGHPTGAMQKGVRLEALMGEGGLDDCGNAQNCVKACPVDIPLTESIAEMGREVTRYAFGKLFGM
ncbi:MAG: succinate dehydrogenase iron-sulfur subunit [Deltaproteobacteria bacterium]|nr:succinate dehydrogenase iron-sulfur subunit [Deltaproteobacteria bacterium]